MIQGFNVVQKLHYKCKVHCNSSSRWANRVYNARFV